MFLNILAIFAGGGLGAVLRYLTGMFCISYLKTNLPIATFIVNIIGSFILGFLYIYFIEKYQVPSAVKLALTVGFCGGLTTFSTFSVEIFNMIQNTQFLTAAIYAILSLAIGIIAVFLGGHCARFL